MPYLSFFADEQDATVLLSWLNAEKDIAFIVPDRIHTGPSRKWKAVHTVEQFSENEYSLWHIPGGPLPLLVPTTSRTKTIIQNPWAGWVEQRSGTDDCKPYFGPGHPSEIRLKIWTRHQPYTAVERSTLRRQVSWYIRDRDLLPASDFQWIGNHYGTAPKQTWSWWRRLARWMPKNTIRVRNEYKESSNRKRPGPSFWTFPSAFEKLSNGMDYHARGYNLDEAISNAGKKI